MELELLLIRHGATVSNESGCYLGKTDESLSDFGKEKLYAKSGERRLFRPDFLFSSPMKRCLETVEILYGENGITDGTVSEAKAYSTDDACRQLPLVLIPEWTEMDFGDFEGKNYQELNGNPDYQAWIDSNGTLPFPHGESREQFTARCMRGFERMLLYVKNNDKDRTYGIQNIGDREGIGEESPCGNAALPVKAAAVVHGGTIMSVLSVLTGKDYFDFQVPNGEGYRVKLCLDNQSKNIELERI